MTWVPWLQQIEATIDEVADEGLPTLVWALRLDVDTDGGRPDAYHIVWAMHLTGSETLELGSAGENAGGSPPVRTSGELEFNHYVPARDGTASMHSAAQAIRAYYRFRESGPVNFGEPGPPQIIGIEDGGWLRFIQRVPFEIEDA